MSQSLNLELVTRLSKDLKQSSSELGIFEVRYLVDLYYQIQDFRIQTAGQVRNILKDDKHEPHATIGFFADNFRKIEDDIKKILDVYTSNHPVGIWAKSIMGVGPVIAAGLIANLDIKDKPTAGHFWSYCGLASGIIEYLGKAKATKAVEKFIGNATKLDYEQLCEICVNLNRKPKNILTRIENLYMGKKQIDPGNVSKSDLVKILSMPPYNTKLKNLCWKIGQSFVKVSNNPNDFYGKIYQEFKAYQNKLNEEGKLADQAKAKLENYNIGKVLKLINIIHKVCYHLRIYKQEQKNML